MNKPSLVVLVKFKSRLSLEEVIEVMERRAADFRALQGLEQKYYLREPATQEYGGLYLWASTEDFTAYQASELRATIAQAYQTEGEPRIEVFDVLSAVRE